MSGWWDGRTAGRSLPATLHCKCAIEAIAPKRVGNDGFVFVSDTKNLIWVIRFVALVEVSCDR